MNHCYNFHMGKKLLKDGLGWGTALWLIGYILGMVFYFVMPAKYIGWAVMPIGTAATIYVLLKRIKSASLQHYLALGIVWLLIAFAGDYFFIVRMLKPGDGYYKPDVYLYYLLAFALPVLVGWLKTQSKRTGKPA